MTEEVKLKSVIMDLALESGIKMKPQKQIADEAAKLITKKYGYNKEEIKKNFDPLLFETELETKKLFFKYEEEFGAHVLELLISKLVKEGVIKNLETVGKVLGENFKNFDRFFLSLAQSRRTRAGKSFEDIHNSLFKQLDYPFSEQQVINGKPDFLMPSVEHYRKDPLDCIIFTSKRTLRERWRQIVTEGTRGRGFYLATIDEKISQNQLEEMHRNKIYLVVPEQIRRKFYPDKINVLSFVSFFTDHLDPAMERWKRNGVI